MNKMFAKVALNFAVRPMSYASWLCIRYLGALSRAYDDAQLGEIYGPIDGCESRSQPWLSRSVQRVIESARVDTGSGCRTHGGELR